MGFLFVLGVRSHIKSGSIGVIRWGDGGMGRWGDGEIEKYLAMVEDGKFFYTELNGFDIRRKKVRKRKVH
ncbi:MAG: hypothetical protein F6K18_05935 [Okeania sp. SIO2C2]|uniref:hypothetical protein n=1 Tax=Okeania sp. SIO2C2 TaxID=2607787 RepID=UPI0013B94499|nr:hypothetical protein [Okeania sp. SIO2C2]NEP86399.1 hypothetical protein [Okeania sp. SIO2C2]